MEARASSSLSGFQAEDGDTGVVRAAWQARTRLMPLELPAMNMASNRARVAEEVEEEE